VARSLTQKTIKCALDQGLQTITVGGGVAANRELRQSLQRAAQEKNLTVYFPPLHLCTDNAAMIACAAAEHFEKGERSPLTLGVQSRLAITEVNKLYPKQSL
jgi:N6-L-threonylcarbamoyladenine synthase